jgi:hypothetical protein
MTPAEFGKLIADDTERLRSANIHAAVALAPRAREGL